jgi:hypothetical protein
MGVTCGNCARFKLDQVKVRRKIDRLVTIEPYAITLLAVAVASKFDPNERILRKGQYGRCLSTLPKEKVTESQHPSNL